MTNPASPVFGVDCPAPDDLQTGDLLFPRKTQTNKPDKHWEAMEKSDGAVFALEGFSPDITVRQLLEHRYPELLTSNDTQFVQSWSAQRLPTGKPPLLETKGSSKSQFDLNDPRVMYLMYKIVSHDMKELFEDWLNMSVLQFTFSRLGRFLFKLLKADDPAGGNFFIGHMAMVIREEAGQVVTDGSTAGQVYVIEANITDFSHYRVAMHPYWAADAADSIEGELRGWANRRLARGEKVWSARPVALISGTGATDKEVVARRAALAAHAKRWHGRPYGFFDEPEFGEPDRMYCAEYLHKVFKDAGVLGGQDLAGGNRTWGWMQRYFQQTGETQLQGYLDDLIAKKGFGADRPFFVLTPPMVWDSSVLGQPWSPTGCGPYSPSVMGKA